MNWYKKAMNWEPFLSNLHKERDSLRDEAAKAGRKLGHVLEGWGPMNSCYCRKCGAYAKIDGVYASDDKKSFYGAAFLNPCSVNFDTPPNFTEFRNPSYEKSVL